MFGDGVSGIADGESYVIVVAFQLHDYFYVGLKDAFLAGVIQQIFNDAVVSIDRYLKIAFNVFDEVDVAPVVAHFELMPPAANTRCFRLFLCRCGEFIEGGFQALRQQWQLSLQDYLHVFELGVFIQCDQGHGLRGLQNIFNVVREFGAGFVNSTKMCLLDQLLLLGFGIVIKA